MSIAATIIDSLQNKPEEWTADKYVLSHKPTGLRIWIANWFLGVSPYESEIPFSLGLIDRILVYRAYKEWSVTYFNNRFAKHELPNDQQNTGSQVEP